MNTSSGVLRYVCVCVYGYDAAGVEVSEAYAGSCCFLRSHVNGLTIWQTTGLTLQLINPAFCTSRDAMALTYGTNRNAMALRYTYAGDTAAGLSWQMVQPVPPDTPVTCHQFQGGVPPLPCHVAATDTLQHTIYVTGHLDQNQQPPQPGCLRYTSLATLGTSWVLRSAELSAGYNGNVSIV